MTTWKDIIKTKLTQSDYVLIAANLIPVFGVWFHGWSAKDVFLVYCLETIIIGLFTLLKMGITGVIEKKDDWQNKGAVTKQPFGFFMIFFLFHYGMFVAIQMGLFFSVSGIAEKESFGFLNFFYKWPQLVNNNIIIMLGVFITSYALRNLNDFILSGEYRTASLGHLMFQPYGRIFIQQVTVILGSMFLSFGAGKIFILIFAVIKIFFEGLINFEGLVKTAAKGELKSRAE